MDLKWLKSAVMKRVYWTNSLFDMGRLVLTIMGGQMVMADVGENGGLTLDPNFPTSRKHACAPNCLEAEIVHR